MIFHGDSFRYFWEVYENNEYSFVFDDLRVLDLGCNVGTFSMWIYPRAERIWAVDREQYYIDQFNKTIKDNELQGITTITDRVHDLAHFMSGHAIDKVDLMKIDIEGDEYEVFDQPNFPAERITTIIGEYHSGDLEKPLTRLGYRYKDLPRKHFLARR